VVYRPHNGLSKTDPEQNARLQVVEAIVVPPTFPPPTTVAEARSAKRRDLARTVTEYIEAAMPEARQRSLLMLLQRATMQDRVNRAAHVAAAADWVESVLAAYVLRCDAASSAMTIEEVGAISEDWTAYDTTKPDPMPTLKSALAILD